MKVFLDTNILLDFWLARPAGYEDARRVFLAAEARAITLYTSSSSLLTGIYFLKKSGISIGEVIAITDHFLLFASLLSPTEKTFRQGLHAGFADLEDGVQYHTALQGPNLDYFITNNKKDFKKATSLLPVLTPKEFLSLK